MAAYKREAKADDEQEKTIPVFTVLKNHAILKNIFLLDNPPSIPDPTPLEPLDNGDQPPIQGYEETLLVGRHPDCNITLEHPSISRFHLRIHFNPSSQKLFVIDLSSVHGTWVSGKKIEPGAQVELNEGDTMRLGSSSRVYRLHWVPLSRAYDLENRFVSPSDVSVQVEESEEEGTHQGMDLVFSNENLISLNNVIPSAPPLPEYMNSPSFSDEEVENSSTSMKDLEHKEIFSHWSGPLATGSVASSMCVGDLSETENQQFDKDNQSSRPSAAIELVSEIEKPKTSSGELEQNMNFLESFKSSLSHEETEKKWSLRKDYDQSEMPWFFHQPPLEESVNSFLPSGIVISRTDAQDLDKENQYPEPLLGSEGPTEIENPESSPMRSGQKFSLPLSLNSSLSGEEGGCQDAEVFHVVENQDPLRKLHELGEIPLLQSGPLVTESVNSCLSGGSILSEIESQQFDKANQSPRTPFAIGESQKENSGSPLIKSEEKSNLASIWSRRGKPSSVLQIQTGRSVGKSRGTDINAEVELLHQGDIKNDVISRALFTGLDGDEAAFTPDKENFTPNTLILKSMKKMGKVEQIKDIMSYRSSSLKNKATSKVLSTGLDENEEPFTPDKENFTPNTLLLRSMKKMGMVEEKKQRSLFWENAVNPNIQLEGDILASSGKEIQTPKVLQEQKPLRPAFRNQESLEPQVMIMKSRAKRVPFQPLLVNSSGKSKSEGTFRNQESLEPQVMVMNGRTERVLFQPLLVNSSSKSKSEDLILSTTTKSSNCVNNVQTMEKNNSISGEKRWNMVVDTTCLLNKESRTALQLLQGLKGTLLIIPRIVIRELDCMNRRVSLFRRITEVSSALQWIEECMVNANWWIHVQSSEEEGRPIAPTPPATPQSQFSEGNGGLLDGAASSVPFSAWGSLLEIVSPTAEDHILECALLFKRVKNDGQLVLLTNDVTLKIKAMAEGLVCETAQEFRNSLVNPFSERFLWADSSPRGRTWSCADDVVLREKYYRCSSRKPSKLGEGAKGLKLILLHNSRYAQSSVSYNNFPLIQ